MRAAAVFPFELDRNSSQSNKSGEVMLHDPDEAFRPRMMEPGSTSVGNVGRSVGRLIASQASGGAWPMVTIPCSSLSRPSDFPRFNP